MKNFLHLVEFHITEHCNLNCKGCVHFSPLAEKSFLKVSEFKKDIKMLKKITEGNVETIHILGGEPLLNPNLIKILKTARKYFKNSEIKLITNGLLVLSQKELFWKTLFNFKIELSITRYPLGLDYSKMAKLANKNKVKCTFYGDEKENNSWCFPLDLDGMQDFEFNFKNCYKGNNCTNINIYKGKLYICPVVSNIGHFNKFFNKNVEVKENDYLKLSSIKNIDEIKAYIASPIPFCSFCSVQERTFNNKWEISKKEIKEWSYEFN